MSLTSCIKKAGKALSAKDKSAILAAASEHRQAGLSADAAAIKAVGDLLADVRGQISEHAAANDPVAVSAPESEKAVEQGSTQRQWDAGNSVKRARMLAAIDQAHLANSHTGIGWDKLSPNIRATLLAKAGEPMPVAEKKGPTPQVPAIAAKPSNNAADLWNGMPPSERAALIREHTALQGAGADRTAQLTWKGLSESWQRTIARAFNDQRSAAAAERDAAPTTAKITTDKAEIRPYRKPDGSIGYEAVPIEQPTAEDKKPDALTEAEKAAKEKMFNAAAKLAHLLSKNTRAMITPEQEQAMLPIVIELFEGAMELGYVKFKQAARYVREFIADAIDQAAADAIPIDTLQGAYIATARRHADKGVTPKSEVVAVENIADLEEAAPSKENAANLIKPEPAATGATLAAGKTLTDHLSAAIADGKMPKDNPALRKLVEQFDGKPASPERMKQAQESLETSIVKVSRDVVEKREGQKSTFDALLRVYESQPNLNSRSSTSIENQAYSTPAPLAWVASELADITKNTKTLEPTGGNGMLLIAADPKNVTVNELNPDRAASLESQGFKPTQKDATAATLAPPKSQDRVITNPPFGPIKNAAGESIKVKVDGYTLGQIDHLIAARALEAMKDDGKATLIIGANKAPGQRSNNDLIFFNWLYGNYKVSSHFEVDGGLYSRQGAEWPVRVITVNGRGESDLTAPLPGTIQRAYNWGDVYDQFQRGLDAQRGTQPSAGRAESRPQADDARPVSGTAQGQDQSADHGGPESGQAGNGNVAGQRAGLVVDRPADTSPGLGERSNAVGSNDQSPGPIEHEGLASAPAAAKPARNTGSDRLSADPDNQFQTAYVPRSSRKDEGVLIPVNMAGPTQDALNRLEDKVGDIDKFAAKELGYKSTEDMHNALMGLQVDSVASAIDQMKSGKAVIIADQTGIGKGRQAAAIIRWAAKNDKTPIFITAKPSLFTDMFGDLHDIGTDDIAPFILNKDESIKGEGNEKLFANRPGLHRGAIERIAQSGELPSGRNAVFMTYSQINTDNAQRRAVLALAPKSVIILDEAHNAAGDSGTGKFMTDALGLAHGVTYLSATYAKRPDNMPLYFKTDIGEAIADEAGLMQAMSAGGLPLQTVVSNNLVKAGQMFRRERSYEGVSIVSRADTAHRDEHVKLSDETTAALRSIVRADKIFHESYVKALQKELEKQGEKAIDAAGNQIKQGVDHTQFSSVVHNFVRQMLLGLKAQEAASEAVRSIKRGEKPLIAVENTMGSFLNEYAEANGLKAGDSLGNFDYRTVLSRALERSRYVLRQMPNGDKVKEYIPLNKLDPLSFEAYQSAQRVIDGLKIDIPVSPIDWMRNEITKEGHTVAEVTGRNLSVDYSDPKNPKLAQVDALEQHDKVRTTRRFNDGSLDSIILNVAGSTGISLHASEKFADQRQRHMIVAQPAQDINIFMQMLGRVHRTGQVRLPKYTLLNADLPAEIRPTAVLSGKMKSLNANTSSNTESATSVRAVDMLNKYGDGVVQQYLADNPELARALDLVSNDVSHESGPEEDIARKATGRLALMPVKVQEQFYAEVEEQYRSMIEYLDKTNQNELEPRTFDFDAKELKSQTLFEGQNKDSPFGQDADYGEYSVKAQGKAMTPDEIRAAMTEHLAGETPEKHAAGLFDKLRQAEGDLFTKDQEPEALEKARATLERAQRFVEDHKIGDMFRVEINGEPHNAVITNLQNTHKSTGNPYSMSKFRVTIAVNGALRSLTVPATQFDKIETGRLESRYGMTLDNAFKAGPTNDRETAKIVTGNLLGAYGEMEGTRGAIITFTKADGTTEQGILLPKKFDIKENARQDYRLKSGEDAVKFLTEGEHENLGRFGINSRDQVVRVLSAGDDSILIQVPKSKAQGGKYFLDPKLRAITGDFFSVGNTMRARVEGKENAAAALDVLMQKQALYALPSMAEEARRLTGDNTGPANQDRPAMFKGGEADLSEQAAAMKRSAVERAVQELTGNWLRKPEIIVIDSMDEAPDAVRSEFQMQQGQGGPNAVVHGFHLRGKVYIVASAVRSMDDVREVLFHEALGHFGLRGFFGKALNPILEEVIAQRKRQVTAKAHAYGLDMGLGADRLMAAEEVLAELAQTRPDLPIVRRAIAAIRTWLRTHVPGFENIVLTDDEIVNSYILPARGFVERGRTGAPTFTMGKRAQAMLEKQWPDLQEALGRYNDGEAGETAQDLLDSVEGLVEDDRAPSELQAAVDAYRKEIDDDRHVYGGRNDMDAAESAFIAAVEKALKKAPAASKVTPLRATSPEDRLAAMGYRVDRGYEDEEAWIEHQDGTTYAWDESAKQFQTEDGEPLPQAAADIAQYIGNEIDGKEDREDVTGVANDRNFVQFSKKAMAGETARQYTPDQLAAMDRVGFRTDEPSLKERAQAVWKDAGKKLAQGLVDQFAPVKDLSKAAYGLLRLAKGSSGAFEAFLRGGRLKLTDGVYDFDDTKRGGVVDRLLVPLGGEHHDFFRWVAANRAERLTGEGKEHLFTAADIAALKTLDTGTTTFDYTLRNAVHGNAAGTVTRDRTLIYRDSQIIFNEFNKNALDLAEQSGLIDGASRHLWEHEFYVPFYRVADEADGGIRGANIKGGVVRQEAFKALKGGKGALNADLLDNTLMNWAHLLDAAAKNRAAKATLEAAESAGIAISAPQYTGQQIAAATASKQGLMWVMDGGVKRYYVLDQQSDDGPFILTALTSLEYAGMRNPVMNAMGAFKHALTMGVTASPFFKVRNLIRDSIQAIGTGATLNNGQQAGLTYNPLGNIAQGWKLTDPKADSYFRLLAGGGTIHFGTMLEGSEAKRVQALVESGVQDSTILNSDDKVKAFYRKFIEPGITAYNELGNRGEAINRAALYDQLTKQGVNHGEASLLARDLMDFSMQGSFTTVRFLTQVVPFFNARIQGLYKLGRAAKEDPKRFGIVLGAAALGSIALLAAYADDDDWKKREDWDRNNFWWFKFGGTAFRIPKPFEIGAMATLAERGWELAFEKEMTNKRFLQQVKALLGDNLSLNPIPQLVKPLVDVYANHDSFTDKPIESMGMEHLKPEYRFSDRTSMLARGASTALNKVTGLVNQDAFSPVQIDHMLRGYFGWLGTFIVGASDAVARPATGQPAQAAPDYMKSLTGGMASDLRDAPSRYVSQMYVQAKEIEQAYGTWKQLQKEGKVEQAQEFRAANTQDLAKYHSVERLKKLETGINQQLRVIEQNPSMSPDEKRGRIRELQRQKDRVARNLVAS